MKIIPMLFKLLPKTNTIKAYKDHTAWYVGDLNGFSKNSNQLVAGVPQLIEFFVGKNVNHVYIKHSKKEFVNSDKLELIFSEKSGSTYQYIDPNGVQHMIWLCPVFFWYYPKAPESLYFQITKR